MTAPATLYDLPAVQDAIQYALAQLADWQLVPQRIETEQAELQRLAREAMDAGDAGTVAQLAAVKQSLDGVQREYLDAGSQVASVMNAARALQAGGSVSGSAVVDAAKLVTTMAANLGVLAQDEQVLVGLGGNLTVGSGGGTVFPTWVKWGLVGLGILWLVRKVL